MQNNSIKNNAKGQSHGRSLLIQASGKTAMTLPFKSLVTTPVSQAYLGLETMRAYTRAGLSKLP